MADSQSNEDRLLRSALGPTAECLPVEALEALDEKGRAHVEHCAYCQNELAMLMEFQEAQARPEELASVAWIQDELARRQAAPVMPVESLWSRMGSWMRTWQMVPVAAALLLLVGGAMYLRQGNESFRPSSAGEQVWRGQGFSGLSPVGDVAGAPAELKWDAVPGASMYLVRVMEVDRTEIWHSEAAGTQAALPSNIRAQMTAGRSFVWVVKAMDVRNHTISESGLQTFHILETSH